MYELKTKATDASILQYLQSIASDERRADCERLIELMSRITGSPPVLWGPSIVGFGDWHYKYASGREGDWFIAGFSPRARDLTVYVTSGFEPHAALMKRLGRYKTSRACLYLRSLADIDLDVLKTLVEESIRWTRARSAQAASAEAKT